MFLLASDELTEDMPHKQVDQSFFYSEAAMVIKLK